MKHKYYEIKAEGKKAKIFIYEKIGSDIFSEGLGAKDFAETLNTLEGIEEINLHINSPGGMVFEGIAIYNTLLSHPAKIIVHIDGVAASIASVIAMAGDEIRIAKNGMIMIHDPKALVFGTTEEFLDMAARLEKIKESLVTAYLRVSPMSGKVISALMSKETWFTAQEAKDSGLVHEITGAERIAACFDFKELGIKDIPDCLDITKSNHNLAPENKINKDEDPKETALPEEDGGVKDEFNRSEMLLKKIELAEMAV